MVHRVICVSRETWDVDGGRRSTYRQTGYCLPSDLSDAEWVSRLGAMIPAAKPGGRPRKTDMTSR